MRRNLLFVFLAGMVMLLLLVGCQKTLVKAGSVTLKLATFDNWYTPASYRQNLPVWQEIEKKTGVKIAWDVMPSEEFDTNMATRLAAGTSLPDILYVPGGGTEAYKYGKQGILVGLKKLIDENAPNTKKYWAGEGAVVRKLLTTPEGEIYSIATSRLGVTSFDPWTQIVRKDWLDKLGMAEPKTIDDWYSMLAAFKNQDPNGNGTKDEIPCVFYEGALNDSLAGYWGNAWGLHFEFSSGFWPDASGAVQWEWIDPRAKEMTAWFAKLYGEGLIDPEFATRQFDSMQAVINQGRVGVTSEWVNYISMAGATDAIKKSGWPNAEYIVPVPPGGPSGYKGHLEKRPPIGGLWSISKDCTNAKAAVKWLDYVYASPEGIRFANYGVEGKSYTMVNAKPRFTAFVKNNSELGWRDALMSIGALPNVPYVLQRSIYEDINDDKPKLLDTIAMLQPYLVDPFPSVMPTEEESNRMGELFTDIQTYQAEMIMRFVMGKESMTKWDEYVSKVKAMGIDEVLKIRQAQWDRFQKS